MGVGALGLALASPAAAAETNTWSAITVSAAGTPFSGSVTLAGGFPATTFTSTASAATRVSGASTWLVPSTPVGAIYGTSRNHEYLNLTPAAVNASSPSITTYAFASPTPAAGWSFVLGDIDADLVTVSATGVDGLPVGSAGLGFRSVFNYCHQTGGPSCDAANLNDVPVWSTTGTSDTLTGNFVDTNGAAGWFSPTVPLRTLTLSFRWQSGAPIYQTWFVDKTRSASGVATLDGAPLAEAAVEIHDRSDVIVATTQTATNGSWTVPALVADAGYSVEIEPVGTPSEPAPPTEPAAPVTFDLRQADAPGLTTSLVSAAPLPSPTPTATPTASPSPTPTASPTPSASPAPSASPTPSGAVDPSDATSSADGELAPTGVAALAPLLIAAVAIAVGAVVFLVSRRRGNRSTH